MPPARLPGMRLMAVEVLNWGTFDAHVWRLDLDGANALLTGEIGSGKSTLVDAITTLIVPAHKISYNKAAGAEMRERDLRSYVLGHFKAERGETGLSAKAIGLRKTGKTFSVILGRFRHADFGEDVTLAQVFWFRQATGQPERFFVVASTSLSIKAHFSSFGSDPAALRKRLRKLKGVQIFDSFPGYGAAFRRLFGIAGEQALDLFAQTVSMKQVGDLTQFVRSHMLEPFPVEERIGQMLAHFADLTAAHEAVLKARDQISRLTPIVEDCDRLDELDAAVKRLWSCRTALGPYFGGLKCDLLTRRLADIDTDLDRLGERIAKLRVDVGEEEQTRDAIRQAIFENGGNRIASLDQEIGAKRLAAAERRRRAGAYAQPARELGLEVPQDGETFVANLSAIDRLTEELTASEVDLQNREVEALVPFRQLKETMAQLEAEIGSLKSRRSSIAFATHGVVAGVTHDGSEPGLILTPPQRATTFDDGFLSMSEIMDLKLDADLVILSACDTATADGRPLADGLSGLARAFFSAGARNIVATHWTIPSLPAVEITTRTLSADPAIPLSERLQNAQIQLMDSVGQPRFAHPASWGAFEIISTR